MPYPNFSIAWYRLGVFIGSRCWPNNLPCFLNGKPVANGLLRGMSSSSFVISTPASSNCSRIGLSPNRRVKSPVVTSSTSSFTKFGVAASSSSSILPRVNFCPTSCAPAPLIALTASMPASARLSVFPAAFIIRLALPVCFNDFKAAVAAPLPPRVARFAGSSRTSATNPPTSPQSKPSLFSPSIPDFSRRRRPVLSM